MLYKHYSFLTLLTLAARKVKDDCRAIGHVASEKFAVKVQTVVRSLPHRRRLAHGSFSCGQFQVSIYREVCILVV